MAAAYPRLPRAGIRHLLASARERKGEESERKRGSASIAFPKRCIFMLQPSCLTRRNRLTIRQSAMGSVAAAIAEEMTNKDEETEGAETQRRRKVTASLR